MHYPSGSFAGEAEGVGAAHLSQPAGQTQTYTFYLYQCRIIYGWNYGYGLHT
ncbi:hypothetical protein [Neobacillus mesonae]|uniref:hypothetical protein n=1 Tax=Neobacillus mesonae TaxID=1193713 RepID=UPI0013E03FD7|nr:hypothetical protein [Neobacillus mesonae]